MAAGTPRPPAEIDAELTRPGGPFEMEELVIRGVPTRTWRHAPPSLAAILRHSRGYGDLPFIVYEDEVLTFEDHFRAAASLAHALRERFGVVKGDRVAIAMRNLPEWSIAFWGAAAAGAVVVCLNAWWTGPELAFGLRDSGTKVLLADGERAARVASVALRDENQPTGLEAVVVVRPPAGLAPGSLAWPAVVGQPGADDLPPVDLSPEDDATIFYTSGTTGGPKGVLGTHRNICTNPVSARYFAARAAARSGVASPPSGGRTVYLLSVPLFHVTGCHSILAGHLSAGSQLVMMHRWDAGRALELIERERVTSFGGVPTMALQVLDHPDLDRRDVSSVTSVRYGGAPAPPALARRIDERFGHATPMNGYGMTETSALTTMNVGADYLARPDSVGLPAPVVDVRIAGPQGEEMPVGAVGELWIRGPNVVKGYWNRPEETALTFAGGWVRTGDVARVDEEGFVYIVDRAKDMLIRGGENVHCVEIEGVLHAHPAVAEAAVIGVPHPTLGEEVGAVVTLHPGASASPEDLRRFVAERLAAFKVPSHFWFRPGKLPRNPAGKVVKRDLREELLGVDSGAGPRRGGPAQRLS